MGRRPGETDLLHIRESKTSDEAEAQKGVVIRMGNTVWMNGRGQEACKDKSEERDEKEKGGAPLLHQVPVSQIGDLDIFWFSKRDKIHYIQDIFRPTSLS